MDTSSWMSSSDLVAKREAQFAVQPEESIGITLGIHEFDVYDTEVTALFLYSLSASSRKLSIEQVVFILESPPPPLPWSACLTSWPSMGSSLPGTLTPSGSLLDEAMMSWVTSDDTGGGGPLTEPVFSPALYLLSCCWLWGLV